MKNSIIGTICLMSLVNFETHAQKLWQFNPLIHREKTEQREWAHRQTLNRMGQQYLEQVMGNIERQKRAHNAYINRLLTQQRIAEENALRARQAKAAQLRTAPQMDNWLRSYATPAQRARYNRYYNNLTKHFQSQDWAPGRKYNLVQARLAAYRYMRSTEGFNAYANLIVDATPAANNGTPANGTPNLFIIIQH